MVLSDRVAVMNDGVLQQFAEPMTIYRAARQPLRGRLHRQPADELPARAPTSPGGHGARAGGRRAAITTSSPSIAGAADGFRLAGELALIEPAGPVHYLDVQVGPMMIKATCADPTGLSPGAPLTLSAPGNCLHVFDRDSGNRLAS